MEKLTALEQPSVRTKESTGVAEEVRWTTAARDREGRRAVLYAYAGDHYSVARPGARQFCVGCHPGHSGVPTDTHKHAEKVP